MQKKIRSFRAFPLAALLILLLTVPALASGYAEGTYTVPFSVEGLGRHNIAHESATVHVEGDALYVDFTLERVDPRDHAPQYDWMDAGLGRCVPTADDAAFTCSFERLQVPELGTVDVTALTSAMSQPHEVEYRLLIDSSSIPAAEPEESPAPAEPAEEAAQEEVPATAPAPAPKQPSALIFVSLILLFALLLAWIQRRRRG